MPSHTLSLVIWARDRKFCVQDAVRRTAGWSQLPHEIIAIGARTIPRHQAAQFKDRLKQIPLTDDDTPWDGLVRAVRVASGDLVGFLNAQCVAGPEWLTRLGAPLSDPRIGCVCGDILIGSPQEDEQLADRSQQRTALSGWRGSPFACLDNAAFRREIFDKIGDLPAALGAAAEAEVAARMFEKTDYRLAYAPEAAVHKPTPQNPADTWDEEFEAARDFSSWLRSTKNAKSTQCAAITASLRESVLGLVRSHTHPDGQHDRDVRSAWTNLNYIAGLVGALNERASANAEVVKAARNMCSLCGGNDYVPGPGGRMVGTVAPQCATCGSLERHRVLSWLLRSLDPTKASETDILCLGEALRRELHNNFRSHRHLTMELLLAEISKINADLIVATQPFSSDTCADIVVTLRALVSHLNDDGILVIVEPLLAPEEFTTRRKNDNLTGFAIGADLGALLGKLLPKIYIGSALLRDDVTNSTILVLVGAQATEAVTKMLIDTQATMLARLST